MHDINPAGGRFSWSGKAVYQRVNGTVQYFYSIYIENLIFWFCISFSHFYVYLEAYLKNILLYMHFIFVCLNMKLLCVSFFNKAVNIFSAPPYLFS